MNNRRKFLACAACLAVGNSVRAQNGQSAGRGCLLRNPAHALGLEREEFGSLSDTDGIANSSGDLELDKALGKTLARAARRFEISPAFAFYRDADAPNAFASPDTTTSGTWGSVVFGRTLFQQQFARYSDHGISVVAIIAHEFGHILQYKNRLIDDLQRGEPTVRRIELHADFISGWYLGERKKENPTISLWASGDTFRRIGDYEFNNPKHHGTPEQRIAASQAGFELAKRGGSSVADVLQEGVRYLRGAKLS